jgi:hypothetical protein
MIERTVRVQKYLLALAANKFNVLPKYWRAGTASKSRLRGEYVFMGTSTPSQSFGCRRHKQAPHRARSADGLASAPAVTREAEEEWN